MFFFNSQALNKEIFVCTAYSKFLYFTSTFTWIFKSFITKNLCHYDLSIYAIGNGISNNKIISNWSEINAKVKAN